MKLYHDYTEKERANMTQEQVEALLDSELMSEGVLKPAAPILKEIKVPQLGERKTFFRLTGKSRYGSDEHTSVAFPSVDAARRFIELGAVKVEYDYECGGQDYEYAIPMVSHSISTVELYDQQTINTYRSQLTSNKAAMESNARAQDEYKKACEASSRVTEAVWSDWHECLRTQSKHQKVIDTYAEYTRMCNGDTETAAKFLNKIFNTTEVDQAFEWFDKPSPFAPKCMPAEATH